MSYIRASRVKDVDPYITKINCVNFARNVNYVHENISSFEGFIASKPAPMIHTRCEKKEKKHKNQHNNNNNKTTQYLFWEEKRMLFGHHEIFRCHVCHNKIFVQQRFFFSLSFATICSTSNMQNDKEIVFPTKIAKKKERKMIKWLHKITLDVGWTYFVLIVALHWMNYLHFNVLFVYA